MMKLGEVSNTTVTNLALNAPPLIMDNFSFPPVPVLLALGTSGASPAGTGRIAIDSLER